MCVRQKALRDCTSVKPVMLLVCQCDMQGIVGKTAMCVNSERLKAGREECVSVCVSDFAEHAHETTEDDGNIE